MHEMALGGRGAGDGRRRVCSPGAVGGSGEDAECPGAGDRGQGQADGHPRSIAEHRLGRSLHVRDDSAADRRDADGGARQGRGGRQEGRAAVPNRPASGGRGTEAGEGEPGSRHGRREIRGPRGRTPGDLLKLNAATPDETEAARSKADSTAATVLADEAAIETAKLNLDYHPCGADGQRCRRSDDQSGHDRQGHRHFDGDAQPGPADLRNLQRAGGEPAGDPQPDGRRGAGDGGHASRGGG